MKIITLFLFVASFAGVQNSKAQTAATDSAKIARTARRNASVFKLNADLQQRFKENNFPISSDYFKPTAAYVSDANLLNDSVYVQSFRYAAFYNTVNERTPPGQHENSTNQHSGIQTTEPKYTQGVEQIAKKDAKNFKLVKEGREKLRDEQLPNTSDYFKPDLHYASNAALLNDSSYVKAFKEAAFYKSLNKKSHSPGKALLVAGTVSVGIIGVIVLIAAVGKGL